MKRPVERSDFPVCFTQPISLTEKRMMPEYRRPMNARGLVTASTALTAVAAFSMVSVASPREALAADASSNGAPIQLAANGAGRNVKAEDVLVTAKKKNKAMHNTALGTRTILETPFSISQVTSEQIKTLGAATINDAFSYDSAVKIANSGVASGNTFRVRGLLLDRTNGYKVDGLPFPYWFQDMPLDSFQSVELLKGLGGFLYGFAAPGGILDFESKEPTDKWLYEADAGVRSSNIFTQHVDAGGPITPSGDTAIRVNLEQESGYLYNNAYNEEYSGSIALTGKITPDLTWSLNGFYLNTTQLSQVNSISLVPMEGVVTHLSTPKGKLDLGAAGDRKSNSNPLLTPSINWNFAPNWKATFSYRYSNLDEQFPGSLAEILDNSGKYVNLAFNINRYFEYNLGQAQVEGHVTTGPFQHDIVFGGNVSNVIFDLFNPPAQVLGFANLYDYGAAPPVLGNANGYNYDHQKVDYKRYQTIWQDSLFFSDTVSYGPVSLLAGFRYNDYAERDLAAVYEPTVYDPAYTTAVYNEEKTEKQIISYNLHPITPSFALIVDVAPQTKAYVSYSQALQTGVQAPTTGVSNPSAFLPPITSTQWEVGLKSAYGIVNGTVALFRIEEPIGLYGTVLPGSTLPIFTLSGNSRYQGIEFNPSLRIDDDLTVNGSLAYLDATYTGGNAYLDGKAVSAVGKFIPGASPLEASLFAFWRLPPLPQLTLDGGARYTGHSYGDTLNLLHFPSYAVFDVGASYVLPVYGKRLTLRAHVQNLFDRDYWVVSQAQVSAGPPRTYTLNAEVDF
jgi:iron complex outermembrane receptor protein